ncbi:LysE family translocator [Kiloniella sp.]|uniref:LysE family translocator n=1 Tax=Kiloniella sp. TaxID=1938587 RepID=UPI003B01D38A
MSIELWLAFVVACTVVTLAPGPCVLLLIGQALSRGVTAAFSSIVGILLGDIFLMLLSLMGLGAILGSSEVLFQVVKWAGVFYMAYLGYCQIIEARKAPASTLDQPQPSKKLACFKAGFLSAALNPKGIMFYLAFLPQFMVPTGNTGLQILILLATSTIVVALVLAAYVLAAAKAKKLLFTGTAKKRINYVSGGCLMGGSAMMAVLR